MSRILSPSFKYVNAADSSKPGYLRRKFERIRRELAESEKAKPKAMIRQIKKVAQ